MNGEKYLNIRIASIQRKMEKKDIKCIIVNKPENVFYFTNFNPILNSHPVFVIIPVEGEATLLVHSLRNAHAREESLIKNIQLYGKWGDNVSIAMNYIDAIKIIVGVYGFSDLKIASELSSLTLNNYKDICKTLKVSEIYDISSEVDILKMVKDDYEISLLRKSALLADRAMEIMIKCLREGLTEAQVCTEAQYAMRKLWQEKFPEYEISGFGNSEGGIIDALNCWCLVGERISYGCDCPSNYKPQAGELVLPQVWSKLGGYHIENERTMYVKEMDEFKAKVFDTVLKAREEVFSIIKPGITFEDMYVRAAKVFEENGFKSILPGRIGHGIGLSAHEFPSIKEGNQIRLTKGMVFTVEPGLMSVNWGGVRHSDTVLVTNAGYEILTKTERGILKIQ